MDTSPQKKTPSFLFCLVGSERLETKEKESYKGGVTTRSSGAEEKAIV